MFLPYRLGENWGYLDKSGQIVIQARFESTGKVDGGNPYGIRDDGIAILSLSGEELSFVPNAWSMNPFSQGLLAIHRDDKVGYCNQRGEVVIAPQFEVATTFGKVSATACVGTADAERWGRLSPQGKWHEEPRYAFLRDLANIGRFSGGRLVDSDKYVVVDELGRRTIEEEFLDVRLESEGLIPVRYTKSRKMGWIDIQGNRVCADRFDDLGGYFTSGMIAAKVNDHWGVVDVQGNWVFEATFSFIGHRSSGLWSAVIKGDYRGDFGMPCDELQGFVDDKGAVAIPPKFMRVHDFKSDRSLVYFPRSNDASIRTPIPFGYVDPQGTIVWQEESGGGKGVGHRNA
ncbi:hypothetical protein RISK_005305 [Rhodopirellula islandica]|uniref:WG repeat-containing protein n=1 Tax=Rhodopirellula islandica TaxID=595434 RepID=A0A0J1E9U7_RHOIS|nr:hypothetical protein RISK_005305 [Rhodopirellula islandica]